jgi:putative flippase GtrA
VQAKRYQFLRFCAVGVAGLLVDTAVLYAVAPVLGWYGARVLSFGAAASATWWLNRRYTFTQLAGGLSASPAPARWSVLRQYGQYLLSMTFGGGVNYAVYVLTLKWVHLPDSVFLGVAFVGVALGSCAGLVFNFLSARYLVFRSA